MGKGETILLVRVRAGTEARRYVMDLLQPFQQFNWMLLGAVSVEHFP